MSHSLPSPINVAFAADDNYAQHLAVAIASLLENSKAHTSPIEIFVLCYELAPVNRRRISGLVGLRDNSRIEFVSISPEEFAACPIVFKEYSVATYYRLRLPSLFPNLEKMIYLDSDLVVQCDIRELWSCAETTTFLKAVEEPVIFNLERLSTLGLDESKRYFNAGVLCLNLEKMRAEDFENRCFDFINRHSDKIKYVDQDVLNAVCGGNWEALSPKYNSLACMQERSFDQYYRFYGLSDLLMAAQAPAIVHFNEHPKPWARACRDPRRFQYFRYIFLTGYRAFLFRLPFMMLFVSGKSVVLFLGKTFKAASPALFGRFRLFVKRFSQDRT
jgi:lipopolysaccharide biosynthesis glycosyltransferase